MSFVTTINIDGLIKKVQNAEASKVKFANRVLHDCTPLVPRESGALQGSGHVEGENLIVWDEEYAVYVYNMPESNNFGTPGTTSHWFEHAKAEKLGDWQEFAKKCVGSSSVSFNAYTGD